MRKLTATLDRHKTWLAIWAWCTLFGLCGVLYWTQNAIAGVVATIISFSVLLPMMLYGFWKLVD